MNNDKIKKIIQGLRDWADKMEKELPVETGYTISQLRDGTAPEGVYKTSGLHSRWVVLKNKKGDATVLYAFLHGNDIWLTQREETGTLYYPTNETFHWGIKGEL
jgi:hypothetical protein